MDFHLDSLLNLPNVTVFTSSQKEGFIFLKLESLNEGINCPHCQSFTDILHQNRPILVRDLSICGLGVYLQVPRRLQRRACDQYDLHSLRVMRNVG
jgi:hypothetical protein